MASKNPFGDKLLELPDTILGIGVEAHQLIFPQETFGVHLLMKKAAPNCYFKCCRGQALRGCQSDKPTP